MLARRPRAILAPPLAALAWVLVATTGTSAQQLPRTDPIAFDVLTATRDTGWPFGYANRRTLRYQQIHDGLAGEARPIEGLAFRRAVDDVHLVPAFRATVSLDLATATAPAAAIDATFATNLGADRTRVLNRARVSLPSTQGPWPLGAPAPFEYLLPLPQPWSFGGTGPFAFELLVHDHTNRTDARYALHAEGQQHQATFGTACGGLALSTTIGPTEIVHRATGLPPLTPAVLFFGLRFDQAFGTPLPLDLDPLGATDCEFLLDPVLQVRGLSDMAGVFEQTVPFGVAPPPGAFYGCQVMAVQPGLNPLGAQFSDGNVLIPQTDRVVGRVWAESTTAATGQRQPVFGLVVQLR